MTLPDCLDCYHHHRRIDWIHWIESARQARTRLKRVADVGDMFASGKKRVCCFDPSGCYSKSLAPPREAQ